MVMTAAPALNCGTCGRTIAKARTHLLLDGPLTNERVICIRCLDKRTAHADYYPDCTVDWHDVYDHPLRFATRAAAANLLGLWP